MVKTSYDPYKYKEVRTVEEQIARKKKYRRNSELLYVSDYLATFYPDDITKVNVKLGPRIEKVGNYELTESEKRALYGFRAWADGIAITENAIILIEGKIKPERYADGIGKLELYSKMVPRTPELEPYRDRVLYPTLLVPIRDPTFELMCREHKFRYTVWCTPMMDKYLETLQRCDRSPMSYGDFKDEAVETLARMKMMKDEDK